MGNKISKIIVGIIVMTILFMNLPIYEEFFQTVWLIICAIFCIFLFVYTIIEYKFINPGGKK